MSKVVLIFDEMPGCCSDCPCYDKEWGECKVTEEEIYNLMARNDRGLRCPLKEMPERKPDLGIDIIHPESLEGEYYNDGWNACIDELEKE